jgi:hypothetical protein
MKIKEFIKRNLITVILSAIGLLAGFLYWKFVGCADGTCAIKSNVSLMTLYGGLMGGLVGNVIQGFVKKKV